MTIEQTNMIAKITAVVAALGLIAFGFCAAVPARSEASTVLQGPYLQNATTSAAIAVTSSTRLIATSTNPLDPANSHPRIYASFCNPSSNPVYINMNADQPASTAHAVAVIAAATGYSACFYIDDRNAYSGSVTASSTGQTSTSVLVSEYVQ